MRQSGRRTAAESMEWCLCEAIRDNFETAAVKARGIAVAMGERKGHMCLVMTFWACAGLEVCHGSIAFLLRAVHKVVENFCCPRHEHPGMNPVPRAVPGPTDRVIA